MSQPWNGIPGTGFPAPVVRPPTRRGVPGVGAIVLVAVLGVLALLAVVVVGLSVGPAALPAAGLLALVPLAGVLLAIRWVDRWEPEPWVALAVAFGWGASVSVLVALVLNTGVMLALVATGSDAAAVDVVGATVVAPVVEETIKALGVLLVLLAWRRSFDGPVDGLVYAATVAAGFAFVENILYFGTTITESAAHADAEAAVATVFVLRAVMSPFAHVVFTACTGLALGLAARSRSPYAWTWALPLGLLGAIALHALWNGSAVMSTERGWFGLYVTVQVPIFLVVVGLVVWLRRREGALVRDRLLDYADRGLFAPSELAMLASLRERRRARTWAATRGGSAGRRAMRDYQHAATRLAYHRQRVVRQRDLGALQDEAALLSDLASTRLRLHHSLAV